MTAVAPRRTLGRRLLPLQAGIALQNFMLWVAVEKLFMSEIGFTAVSIGVMAAAYAVVVPLLLSTGYHVTVDLPRAVESASVPVTLGAALGPDAARAQWRNIWEDLDAAEIVRGINNGDEIVPTVVIDGKGYTNPDPALVHEALLE